MFKQWLKDESGQAMSEYGLLVAVIAIAIIAAVAAFRGRLETAFKNAGDSIGNQDPAAVKKL